MSEDTRLYPIDASIASLDQFTSDFPEDQSSLYHLILGGDGLISVIFDCKYLFFILLVCVLKTPDILEIMMGKQIDCLILLSC